MTLRSMTPGKPTGHNNNNMEIKSQESSELLNVSDQEGVTNHAKEIREDLEDIIKSNGIESEEDKITLSLEYLREELIAMQQDDFSLLRQLLTINAKIRSLTSQQPNKSRSSTSLNRSSSFHLSPVTGQVLYRQQSAPNGEFLGIPEDTEVVTEIKEEKQLSSSYNSGCSPVSSWLNVGQGSPLSGLSHLHSGPLPKSFRCRRSSSSMSDYNGGGTRQKYLSHSYSSSQLRDMITRGSSSSSVTNGALGKQMKLSHSLTAAEFKDTPTRGLYLKPPKLTFDVKVEEPSYTNHTEQHENEQMEKDIEVKLKDTDSQNLIHNEIDSPSSKKRPIKLTFEEYDYHSLPLKKTYSAPPKSPVLKNLQTLRDKSDAELEPSRLSHAGSFPFLAFGASPKTPYPKSQPTTPSHLTKTNELFYEAYLKKSSQLWKDIKRDEEEGIVDERKVNTLQMFM